jgi:hypothetical protein
VTIGCSFSGGGGPALLVDASADADTEDGGDDQDAANCQDQWAPDHADPCDLPMINGALAIDADATYDTETNELVVGGVTSTPETQILTDLDPDVRLVLFESVAIAGGATLAVTGSMPLLLASNSTIQIQGSLAVAAALDAPAAGSEPAACTGTPPTVGTDDDGGAGGGGGGGSGGIGGTGGTGDSNDGEAAGGTGGDALSPPNSPRGGCAGARGGEGTAADFGLGGAGGGAVQLSARTLIAVSGSGAIDAGGGGGGGAQGNDCGGGGGGSGGYIRLDAIDIDVLDMASVTANGGGGGGGSTSLDTADGDPGENGTRTDLQAAGGDASGGSASDGASGGAGTVVNGASQNNPAVGGGGGGGGSVGHVIIPLANLDFGPMAFISPDPIEQP